MSTTPGHPNPDGSGAAQPQPGPDDQGPAPVAPGFPNAPQAPSAPGFPSAPAAQGFPSAPHYGLPAEGGVGVQVEQPPSIRLAVRLMYVGAVLSVLEIVIAWTTRNQLHDRIVDSLRNTDRTLTAHQVDSLVTVSLAVATVLGLAGVGLWIWMATENGAGRSWARVVATVLGGLNVLSLLTTVGAGRSSAVSTVASLVSLVLSVVILVLLWRRESGEFYRARSAGR